MKIDLNFTQNYSYGVYINEIDKISKIVENKKVAIITNHTIAKIWLDEFLKDLNKNNALIIKIDDGEEFKNINSVLQICDELFKNNFDRDGIIISFGGGVISDISGFVASIYKRGVKFINVATTLLSQVDASVGGKTGINNEFGKNLIGSFYQPSAVFCETKFLKTLPKRQISAGICEAFKMACVLDSKFFDFFEKIEFKNGDLSKESFETIIKKSVEIKSEIVLKDEKESGLRMVLNYGHTFAHAIEKITNYDKFLHGEAVSLGIMMVNSLALNLGILNKDDFLRIKEVLLKFDLPIKFKIENIDNFYYLLFNDKKTKNGKINFVFLNNIGSFVFRDNIDEKDIKNILKEF